VLIVAGHLVVDPTDRDTFVASCAEAVAAARRADGCLDFALSPDPLAPGRVNVFERWDSAEALAAFRGSGPDDDTGARILAAEVARYAVTAVGPA
jgi:quinol monooxygenase YgiN